MIEADNRRNSLQKELVIMKESRQHEMEFKQWKISSLQREKDIFTMEREKWQVRTVCSLNCLLLDVACSARTYAVIDETHSFYEGSILLKATPSKTKESVELVMDFVLLCSNLSYLYCLG